MKYHRVELGNKIYYINDSAIDAFNNSDKHPIDYLAFSDFAVCTATNEVIKCRYPIERMMDQWLDIIPK